MVEGQGAPGAAVDPDALLVVPRSCPKPGCPKPTGFLTEKDWYTHILGHALEAPVKEKNYECPVDACSKVYTHKANLEGHVNTEHCWIEKYVCADCGMAFKTRPDRSKHKSKMHRTAEVLAQRKKANAIRRMKRDEKGPKKGEAKGKRIHQSAIARSIRIGSPIVAASDSVAETSLPHIENYAFAEDVQAGASPQAYALDTPDSTPSATACSSADTTAVNTPSDYDVNDFAHSSSKPAPGAVPAMSFPYSATNSAPPTSYLRDSADMDTGNFAMEYDDTERPVFDYLPSYAAEDDPFSALGDPDASYVANMDVDNDPVVSAEANVSAPVVDHDDPAFGRFWAGLFANNAGNNDVQHDGLQHGTENVADQSMIMPEMNTADDNTQHDGPQHIVENAINNAVFASNAMNARDGVQAMVDQLPHAALVHDLETAAEHYSETKAHEGAPIATETRHFILYTHMPRPHLMATILTTGPVVAADTGNVERALFLWNTPDNMIREDYPARPPSSAPGPLSNLPSFLAFGFNAD